MSMSEYVPLHNHTHNSILDGFSKPQEYIDEVIKLGQKGFGITDHGNTFGVYDLVRKANSAGIIPIPGIEAYFAPENPEGAKVKRPIFYGPNGQKVQNDVSGNGAFTHLTLWAINQEGMKNLFKLSTLSYQPEHVYSKPRMDFEMLAEHSEGLIVGGGCPSSEINTRFLLGQDEKAYSHANRLKEVFGDRFFIEIMDHNMNIDLERKLLPKQLELSKKLEIPLLATNDSHYAHKEDAIHHEEMLCSQSGSRMSELPYDQGGKRFAFNGNEYYLKSTEEMNALFPEQDFPGALKNTLVIAEMAQDVKLDFDAHLKPKPIIPSQFKDEVEYYQYLINKGFKERYGNSSKEVQEEAIRRNKHEFEVIYSSDFIGYMLVVYEYLNWTKENYSTLDEHGKALAYPIGVGRGSVGGSIHAYELGISELDPIKHDLIFERFLSAGRGATARVHYDDGTFEDLIVSDQKDVINLDNDSITTQYVHQLNVGDIVKS